MGVPHFFMPLAMTCKRNATSCAAWPTAIAGAGNRHALQHSFDMTYTQEAGPTLFRVYQALTLAGKASASGRPVHLVHLLHSLISLERA